MALRRAGFRMSSPKCCAERREPESAQRRKSPGDVFGNRRIVKSDSLAKGEADLPVFKVVIEVAAVDVNGHTSFCVIAPDDTRSVASTKENCPCRNGRGSGHIGIYYRRSPMIAKTR